MTLLRATGVVLGEATLGRPPDDMPTDYLSGYEQARAVDPEMASNYVAHTLIADPVAEAASNDLVAIDRAEAARFIDLGMRCGSRALKAAPASLREFFADAERQPEWLDQEAFAPGVRMFHRNSHVVLVAFAAGVLIEGFSTNIARSFMLTGRVRDKGVRRLGQNNRHMMDIFFPGGLARQGDGWKLSVRIRMVHARLRRLLNDSEEWDAKAWGTPISAAHLGFAIAAFSARLLKHMKALGASYTEEECKSFMDVWRYAGYLMGIPDTILFRDRQEALKLYDIGLMCEPEPSIDSIAMAHSLVNSAPLFAGAADPSQRRELARYVYRMSTGLIGKRTAESLNYPKVPVFGVVGWFKFHTRLGAALDEVIPGRRARRSFNRFTNLLAVSTYDTEGIDYRLPDQVYAERTDW